MILITVNLELRSPTVSRKEDLVKVDFEHAYRQQGPIYKAVGYMKNPSLVIANPNRANILFMKSYKGPHM